MLRMERAGLPCRYPHSSHVYHTLASKSWTAHLSALPAFRVPPTCRISAAAVVAGAGAAAAAASQVLANCPMEGYPSATLGSGFVAKLGFSWNAADVRAAASEAELAAALDSLLLQSPAGRGRHTHGHALVQRRIEGILCEPSLFLVEGQVVETRFVTEVLAKTSSFRTMSETEAFERLFQGDHAQFDAVVQEMRRLAELLLRWLVADGGEVPAFVRLDFIVARRGQGNNSNKNNNNNNNSSGSSLEVWTNEVCEMGGGLCGLSGGRAVPFQALLRSCLSALPAGNSNHSNSDKNNNSDNNNSNNNSNNNKNNNKNNNNDSDMIVSTREPAAMLGSRLPAGTAVFVFFRMTQQLCAKEQRLAVEPKLGSRRVGVSDGWLPATVAEDFDPSHLQAADATTWVALRHAHGTWADIEGNTADPPSGAGGVYRAHPRDLSLSLPPSPEFSFLVVRQGGKSAAKVSDSLWFSCGSIARIFEAVKQRFGTRYEATTVFVETSADLVSISAPWVSTALRGQAKLGAYFLCPSLDVAPLEPSYTEEAALLALLGRMESVGVQTWFPNRACQYATLTQKSWSAQLSFLPQLRLPAGTRVPR
ncbi:unnamed protein product, partial [Polarella glacialis]